MQKFSIHPMENQPMYGLQKSKTDYTLYNTMDLIIALKRMALSRWPIQLIRISLGSQSTLWLSCIGCPCRLCGHCMQVCVFNDLHLTDMCCDLYPSCRCCLACNTTFALYASCRCCNMTFALCPSCRCCLACTVRYKWNTAPPALWPQHWSLPPMEATVPATAHVRQKRWRRRFMSAAW